LIDTSKAEANWNFFFFVAKFSVAFAQEKLEINLIVGYELLCKKKAISTKRSRFGYRIFCQKLSFVKLH
jgi:hypothetical protein